MINKYLKNLKKKESERQFESEEAKWDIVKTTNLFCGSLVISGNKSFCLAFYSQFFYKMLLVCAALQHDDGNSTINEYMEFINLFYS